MIKHEGKIEYVNDVRTITRKHVSTSWVLFICVYPTATPDNKSPLTVVAQFLFLTLFPAFLSVYDTTTRLNIIYKSELNLRSVVVCYSWLNGVHLIF